MQVEKEPLLEDAFSQISIYQGLRRDLQHLWNSQAQSTMIIFCLYVGHSP